MPECLLLVTLYNIRIEESTTICSFIDNCKDFYSRFLLYIWDNSTLPIDQNLEIIPKNIHVKYYKANRNTSLAIVYNSILKENDNFDYLFNFDQDSNINVDYLKSFFSVVFDNPDIGMFVPQIYHNNICVSPGYRGFFKNHFFKEITSGKQSAKNVICITSGIVLNIKLLIEKGLKYDENLTLYGVDTKFAIDYSRTFSNLYVLDTILPHDLSTFDKRENKKKKIFRLKNAFKADLYIASNENYHRLKYIYLSLRYIYNVFKIHLIL